MNVADWASTRATEYERKTAFCPLSERDVARNAERARDRAGLVAQALLG